MNNYAFTTIGYTCRGTKERGRRFDLERSLLSCARPVLPEVTKERGAVVVRPSLGRSALEVPEAEGGEEEGAHEDLLDDEVLVPHAGEGSHRANRGPLAR